MALRDTEDIAQRALKLGLIGPVKRQQLLDGLPMGFVYSLPTVSRPMDQLRFDLMELSRTPRLIGLSSPPMAVWLRNAATLANSLHHQGAKQDALFFDQRAAALDGQPVVITIDQSTHTDNSTNVRNIDNSVKTDNSTRIGDVGGNAIVGDSNTVTVNHYYGGSDREAARSPQPASRRAPSAEPPTSEPSEQTGAGHAVDADHQPTLDGPLIAIGVGLARETARRIADGFGSPHASFSIAVPPEAWTRPPTDPDWQLVSWRIDQLARKQISPAFEGDLAIVGHAPPAMLAWMVARLQTNQGHRTRHVFDPKPFSGRRAWAPALTEVDESELEVLEGGPDEGVSDITVYLDFGAPPVWRSPSVIEGAHHVHIRPADRGWRRGRVSPAAVYHALTDQVSALRNRFTKARWHVFYDGPPSLWCRFVDFALRAKFRMTVYASDIDGREHPAIELPRGTWLDPRDPQNHITDRYDVFLAHPESAGHLANQLYQRLRYDGYNVFYEDASLEAGDRWDELAPAAQARSLVTLLVITPDTRGDWYSREEIAAAIEHASRRDEPHRLLPLLASGATRDMLPFGTLRTRALEWPEGDLPSDLVGRLTRAIDATRDAAGLGRIEGGG